MSYTSLTSDYVTYELELFPDAPSISHRHFARSGAAVRIIVIVKLLGRYNGQAMKELSEQEQTRALEVLNGILRNSQSIMSQRDSDRNLDLRKAALNALCPTGQGAIFG